MGTIVYELNEVPQRLFDFYAVTHPRSAFAKLRSSGTLFQTKTADIGGLSPWITWPTMHRGVSNVDHEISDLGQDLTLVNQDFPNIFEILTNNDVKVGVFGSLQSFPLPKNLDNFSFYVPDTFAAGDECYPDQLTDFQSFNLSMVRANGRNVHGGIDVRSAVRFFKSSLNLGLNLSTYLRLTNQILAEKINSDRLVRRRTSQVEIAFDLYFYQLKKTNPDISFFFTNHLASSMHRYWPTIFPGDYESGKFDKDWIKQWSGEIPHAVKIANFQLNKLMEYCRHSGSDLVVCSSMGQGPVRDVEPVKQQVLITNVKSLMSLIGFSEDEWQPKLSMAPRVVITPQDSVKSTIVERVEQIRINGQPIKLFVTSTGDIRFSIEIFNQKSITVKFRDKTVSPRDIGIQNVDLQDASGSYAYHIPEGILIHYKPDTTNIVDSADWTPISVLEFAPSILNKFSINAPNYMTTSNLFKNETGMSAMIWMSIAISCIGYKVYSLSHVFHIDWLS